MNWRMMWALLAIVATVFLLASTARGDIDCKEVYDSEIDPIVVGVGITGVPEGAKLRGSFSISGKANYLPVPGSENTFHCWAAVGTHTLVAQGVWVLTEDIVIGERTVPVLVDFGQYRYEKTITVGQEEPQPQPDPIPPPPPGQRWAVIVDETSQTSPKNRNLYLKLRSEFQSSRLLVLDQHQLPPSYSKIAQAVRESKVGLPVLVVVSESGEVVRVVAVPDTVEAVKQEIAK